MAANFFLDFVGELFCSPFVKGHHESVFLGDELVDSFKERSPFFIGNVGIGNNECFVSVHLASLWTLRP